MNFVLDTYKKIKLYRSMARMYRKQAREAYDDNSRTYWNKQADEHDRFADRLERKCS